MSNAGISWERGEVEAITLNADGTKSLSMRGSDQTLGGYDQVANPNPHPHPHLNHPWLRPDARRIRSDRHRAHELLSTSPDPNAHAQRDPNPHPKYWPHELLPTRPRPRLALALVLTLARTLVLR